ncbi:MAG: hypothetical protein WCP32_16925 [Bacteroidota bacterium]
MIPPVAQPFGASLITPHLISALEKMAFPVKFTQLSLFSGNGSFAGQFRHHGNNLWQYKLLVGFSEKSEQLSQFKLSEM